MAGTWFRISGCAQLRERNRLCTCNFSPMYIVNEFKIKMCHLVQSNPLLLVQCRITFSQLYFSFDNCFSLNATDCFLFCPTTKKTSWEKTNKNNKYHIASDWLSLLQLYIFWNCIFYVLWSHPFVHLSVNVIISM